MNQAADRQRITEWSVDRERPRVLVMGAPNRDRVKAELERLRPAIASKADIVAEDLNFTHDFSTTEQDLVIVLGGDGSILQAARQMGSKQIPVLGVNCGRLGFLAALSPDDFLQAWPDVCCGGFNIIDHLMLRTQLVRDGKVIRDQLALNEVAVLGGPPYQICLLYTSPSPRDKRQSRMPSSA